jgi:hypothetical protein
MEWIAISFGYGSVEEEERDKRFVISAAFSLLLWIIQLFYDAVGRSRAIICCVGWANCPTFWSSSAPLGGWVSVATTIIQSEQKRKIARPFPPKHFNRLTLFN